MKSTYVGFFDYASATPMSDEAIKAMESYFNDSFFNPSALYSAARDIRGVLVSARSQVADVLGVKAAEIVFTAGCTEANNIAIQGVLKANQGGKILVSAVEHDSVLSALTSFPGAVIPVKPDGIVDLEALRQLLDGDVVLVSVMYANNEIGVVQPLREIAAVLDEERKKRGAKGRPLYFHTDAAQAGNHLSLKAHSLGVQLMSLNGGKIYGPKASGCLFVGTEVNIEPLFFGGRQESGLRSGTENVPAIIGFAESLVLADAYSRGESERLCVLQKKLVSACVEMGGVINGSLKERLPNNVNVGFDGVDNEVLVIQLDDLGYQVASGSACHANSGESSHVLSAIGLSEAQSRQSIRISMGRFTSESDVERLLTALKLLLAK